MSDELKIETKTKIAADAAITVNAYLEELTARLATSGIENAFSIVSDTQEIIIDILNKVGSPTKLGTDTCMQLIHEEFGTPDEFVQQYIQDHNLTKSFPRGNDSKLLMKRPRAERIIKSKKVKQKRRNIGLTSFIKNLVGYTFLLIPLVLISSALLIRLVEGRPAYNSWQGEIFTLLVISAVFFTTNELYSGLGGKLIISKGKTILLRHLFRGALLSHLLLALHAVFSGYYFYYSEDAAWIFFFILLFTEIIIFFRDHVTGLYPLEPEFRKWIRFFTPPYLLLLTAILFFPGIGSEEADFPIFFITLIISIWIRRKKYKVSPRFYLVFLTLMFISQVSNPEFMALIIIIPVYYLYSAFKSRDIFQFSMGPFSKPFKLIKRKLNEYYDEQKEY